MSTPTYRILPEDIGTVTNSIRLPFNVAQYHIKKTEDNKNFILGNAIVTGRYVSTICMITDLEPQADDPDSFDVTVTDGTDEFTYSNINKSQFSPGVWARLCGYSNVKASKNKPYNRDKYRTSTYYPIIVKIVSVLSNDVGGDDLDSDWYSCTLFDVTTSAGNRPKPESEEWYNIVRQHNIEKSIAFYEEYCLTPQQKLSLDLTLQNNNNHNMNNNNNNNNSMLQLPVPAYHRILDNPCCPIPMTIDSMWYDTKPIQDEKQQDEPKLLYYGRDVTNRLVHLTLYVNDNTDPCPDDPQCSADCKHVDFSDNSTDGITYHLSKYPPKDSTCYHLCRIDIITSAGEPSTGSENVGRYTIGDEGYKNQQLIDEHEKKAKKVIQQMKRITKPAREYSASLKKEYNKHLTQVKHFHMLVTSRLSTHPLFVTLIEPLQKQLEDTIKTSQQQQFDTIEELNDVLDWNNTTSDLISQCKQIINTLLNTNIALYTDFFDYYLPHVDEQLHHLQQQMEVHIISNPSIIHDPLLPSLSSSSSSQHAPTATSFPHGHISLSWSDNYDTSDSDEDNDMSNYGEDNDNVFNYDEDEDGMFDFTSLFDQGEDEDGMFDFTSLFDHEGEGEDSDMIEQDEDDCEIDDEDDAGDHDEVKQYDDDDFIASMTAGHKRLAEQLSTTTARISQTSSSSSTITSALFNYQRNVIRPIAQYRYNRGHVAPPSSASLTLLHDVGALNNITLSSPNTNNNNTENDNMPHHQHNDNMQHHQHQQQNQHKQQQQDNTNIISLVQQHALQLSSTRQNLLLHAVDYEHALLDIKDDEIIELRKQIKDLQDSNSTRTSVSTTTTSTGGSSFDNISPQSHHLMYESHIKIYQQQLESKDKQLEFLHQHYNTQLETKDKQLESKDKQLESKDKHYIAQLEAKDKQLELHHQQLEAKDRELALLRQLLGNFGSSTNQQK